MNTRNKRNKKNCVNGIVPNGESDVALGRGLTEVSQLVTQRNPRPPTKVNARNSSDSTQNRTPSQTGLSEVSSLSESTQRKSRQQWTTEQCKDLEEEEETN